MNQGARHYWGRFQDAWLYVKHGEDFSLRMALFLGGSALLTSAWILGGIFAASSDRENNVAVTGGIKFTPYAGLVKPLTGFSDRDQGSYVASRGGSVYYSVSCKGWSRIGKGNQVWFVSEESARSAGYERAKSCK